MSWCEQRMVGMIPGVRIEIVDYLERYLVYKLGWWLDWKGSWSVKWVVVSSCSNKLRTGSRE
jgi:hypothetical protein